MCPNVFDNRGYSFFVNNVCLNPESMKCSSVFTELGLVVLCRPLCCGELLWEKRTFVHGLSPGKGKGQPKLTFLLACLVRIADRWNRLPRETIHACQQTWPHRPEVVDLSALSEES